MVGPANGPRGARGRGVPNFGTRQARIGPGKFYRRLWADPRHVLESGGRMSGHLAQDPGGRTAAMRHPARGRLCRRPLYPGIPAAAALSPDVDPPLVQGLFYLPYRARVIVEYGGGQGGIGGACQRLCHVAGAAAPA